MVSEHQQGLRERFLAAPVTAAPAPWRPMPGRYPFIPIGGLLGVGFAPHPVSGDDLLMVVSTQGHGLFHAATGERIARDRDPDADSWEPSGPDLSCPGLGPLAGTRVRIAGLHGGGLHASTDGWGVHVVAPDWPNHQVLLSTDGFPYRGAPGETWWHIFHANYSELRAAGFSPSGRTLVIATSSDVTLLTRAA